MMTDPTPQAHPLPSPPRPFTPTALRQSRRELSVRKWALVVAGVVLVIFLVARHNVVQMRNDRELVQNGHAVKATIDLIYGASRNVDRSVARDLKISYLVPGETEPRVVEHTMLTPVHAVGEPGEEDRKQPVDLTPTMRFMNPGDRLDIRVDRTNPSRWTDRVTPSSWLEAITVPLMLSPIALLLIFLTSRQRKRMLAIYRDSPTLLAKVVELHRSALVPRQRVVKVSPLGGDGRVLTLTLPESAGAPAVGQSIEILVDHVTNPRKAVAVAAYTETPAIQA